MPAHQTLARLAGFGWALSTIATITEMTADFHLGVGYAFLLTVTSTTTVVAALTYLRATTMTPVREAFVHGYQLATQHAAAVQAARKDADLGRVLRPPAGAWTINEPYQQERGPRHRAPSPRQSH